MGPGLGTPMDLSGEKLAFALEDETNTVGFLKYIVNSCKFTRSFGRVELECRILYSPGLLYHFIIVFGGRKRRQTFFVN